MNTPAFSIRVISWAMIALLTGQPALLMSADSAQLAAIQVDSSAAVANRAILDSAANGVPVVNIANPSGQGVSHNKFSNFNVDQRGVIINNSREIIRSQLGGFITGNTNLDNSARIILNEVTGSNPSELLGATEVAGASASYILANPYGITCDGCDFINTPRATLTTGSPLFENGQLSGFSVDDGSVIVNGLGLNAGDADRFDIITRALKLNAELHARELQLVTGRNDVAYKDGDFRTGDIVAKAERLDDKPAFALDANALGSLSANRIFLIGTEQGVGVRIPSRVAAAAGDIRLSVDGKLTLGELQATNNIVVNSDSDDIELKGTAYGERVALDATGALTIDDETLVAARENLSVQAAEVNNRGTLAAGVETDQSLNDHGLLHISVTEKLTNRGQIIAGDELTAVVDGQLDNRNASFVSAGELSVSAASLLNSNASISADSVGIAVSGVLDNQNGRISQRGSRDQILNAGSVNNDAGLIETAATNFTVRVAGEINNLDSNAGDQARGQIIHAGEGQFTVVAADLNNSGRLASNGDLDLTVHGVLKNAAGTLTGGEINLSADRLDNQSGFVEAEKSLTISAMGEVDNQNGTLTSLSETGTTTLIANNGEIKNNSGSIQTNNANLTLVASSVDNSGGDVRHGGDGVFKIDSMQVINDQGELLGNGTLTVSNNNTIDNSQGAISADSINITTTAGVDNTSGTIEGNSVALSIAGLLNNMRGFISQFGNDDQTLTAGEIANVDGTLQSAANNLTLTVAGDLNNIDSNEADTTPDNDTQGKIIHAGAGRLTLAAGNLVNSGRIASNVDLTVTTSDTFNNDDGSLTGENLNLSAASISNQRGLIEAAQSVSARAVSGNINNQNGALTSLADTATTSLIASNGAIINSNGRIQSNNAHLTLMAGAVTNTGGMIVHGGDERLTIDAGSVNNIQGEILTGANLNISASGSVDNTRGTLSADVTTFSVAGNADNTDGTIEANTLSVTVAGLLNNLRGFVSQFGNADQTLTAGTLDNSGGTLQSNAENFIVSAQEGVTNSGGTVIGQSLTIDATSISNANGGVIEVAETLALHARAGIIDNSGGTLTALGQNGTTLLTASADIVNDSGLIQTNNSHLTLDSVNLSNSEGEIRHAGNGNLTLTSTGTIDNQGGTLITLGTLVTSRFSHWLNNAKNAVQGLLQADHIDLDGDRLDNVDGQILATGANSLRLNVNELNNQRGTLFSEGAFSLGVNTLEHAGSIRSMTDLTLDLPTLDFNDALLNAGNNLIINVTTPSDITNQSGNQFLAAGDLQINNIGGRLLNYGELSTGGDLGYTGLSLINYSGAIFSAGDDLNLALSGSLLNQANARLSAANTASITATDITNYGIVAAGENLVTRLSGNLLNYNTLFAGNSAELYVAGNTANYTGANIFAVNDLTFAANDSLSRSASLLNQSAVIEAFSGDITIATDSLRNLGTVAAITTSTRTVNPNRVYTPNVDGGLDHPYRESGVKRNFSYLTESEARQLLGSQEPDVLYLLDNYLPVTANEYWGGSYKRINWLDITATITEETADLAQQNPSQLLSGGNLTINAGATQNQVSLIAADGNINITGSSFSNEALELHETVTGSWTKGNAKRQNLSHDVHYRDIAINATTVTGYLPSSVVAGGSFTGSFSGQLDNVNIRQGDSNAVNNTLRHSSTFANSREVNRQNRAAIQASNASQAVTGETNSLSDLQGGDNLASFSGAVSNLNGVKGSGQTIEHPEVTAGNITLPTSDGLFVINDDPSRHFLVETNPAFASYTNFIGSDYLLERLGHTPESSARRLGDSFYETRLVREAIFNATGQRYLTDTTTQQRFTSDYAQYQYLMDNGVAASQSLNLSLGVALSADQVARLTHDIVWLVQQTVTDANGQTHQVLAPVYYAGTLSLNDLQETGALLQGQQMALNGKSVNNSGKVNATDSLSITSQNALSNFGTIEASNNLELIAQTDLNNLGGRIVTTQKGSQVTLVAREGDFVSRSSAHRVASLEAAGDLSLSANRDVRIQSGVNEWHYQSGRNRSDIVKQVVSKVSVAGDVEVQSGRDVSLVSSQLEAGGNVAVNAGGDITLDAAADYNHRERHSKNYDRIDTTTTHIASEVSSGGNLTLDSGGDITLRGSKAQAEGDIALAATGNTNLEAVNDESYHYYYKKKKKSFGRSKSVREEEFASDNVGSELQAGGNLAINSLIDNDGSVAAIGGEQVNIVGSDLSAGGDLVVYANEAITLDAGQEDYQYSYEKKESGFAGLSKSSETKREQRQTTIGTKLSAGNDAVLISGADTNVLASTIAADENIQINAGVGDGSEGDINIVSGQDSRYDFYEKKKSKVGLSFSSDSISVASKAAEGQENTQLTNKASVLNAGSDVLLTSGRDINVIGSEVEAGSNINIDAMRDVNLLAAEEKKNSEAWEEESKTGLSWSGDDNGINLFAGKQSVRTEVEDTAQLTAGSVLTAGNDVRIEAQRNINQLGGTTNAERDITYAADNNITLAADSNAFTRRERVEQESSGLSLGLQHNFGKTKDAIEGAGKGDNNTSKVSSALRAVDQIGQFLSGPTASASIGTSKSSNEVIRVDGIAQGSELNAGRDINLIAANDATLEGTHASAGRDIKLSGREVVIESAANTVTQNSETTNSWTGIRQRGRSVGAGASSGTDTVDIDGSSANAAVLSAQRDIEVDARESIRIAGSDANAGRDITLNAVDGVTITSGEGHYREVHDGQNSGGEIGITAFEDGSTIGVYVEVQGGQNDLQREESSHRNSHINARNTLAVISGGDTTIAGGNLEADQLSLDVGNNLTVTSLQDEGEVDGSRWDGSLRVTVGVGVSVSGSAGYGETEGEKAWVAEQTSLVGRESVNVEVQHHTQLDGAVVANIREDGTDGGNLNLSTGTLGFSDIEDEHTETSEYTSISASFSGKDAGQDTGPNSGATQTTQLPNNEAPDEDGGFTNYGIEGSYSELDRRQINRATIGNGTITVRNQESEKNSDLASLNRDLTRAQEVTREHQETTELYVTKSAVEDTTNIFRESREDNPDTPEDEGRENTLAKWNSNIQNYKQSAWKNFAAIDALANELQAKIYSAPQGAVEAAGDRLAEDIYDGLIKRGVSPEKASELLGDSEVQMKVLSGLKEISIAFDQEAELFRLMEAELASLDALEANSGTFKRDENGSWVVEISTGAPLRGEQVVVRKLGEINAYINENPDAAQVVETALYVAQGPKGAVTYVIDRALANSPVGEAIAEVNEKAAEYVAEYAERVDLDQNDESEANIIGGVGIATGIILGGISGSKKGGIDNHAADGPEGNLDTPKITQPTKEMLDDPYHADWKKYDGPKSVGSDVTRTVSNTNFDEVTDFVSRNSSLPDNYITKKEARALGWNPKQGNLHEVAPGKSIGGDVFSNREGILPDAPGRKWIEADINYSSGYRTNERLVISSDGLIYKTTDHYKTFTKVK